MKRTIKNEPNQHLKILFVSESFPPVSYGGGEISCALLASGVGRCDDIDVTVLTSEVEGLKQVEKKDKVTILRKLKTGGGRTSLTDNFQRKLFFKRSVKKEIKNIAEDYDLIHFFNMTSIVDVEKPSFATINSYVNFCPKGNLFYKDKEVCQGCSPLKFMECITNSEYVGGHKLKAYLKYNPIFWLALYTDFIGRKKVLKTVDHFFSLSDFINDLLEQEGIEKSRITKVINIPDINKSEKRISLKDDLPIITYIGDLGKIKGVEMLIRAFNKIDAKARLILVGDGPEREKLEELAGKNVDFLGKVDHDAIHSVYQQSHVIVVPSLWPEPLSRVLLEAAYFGKPVIATDVGGSPDVVKDGYNGLLVEPEEDELKVALERMIKNKKFRDSTTNNMKYYYGKNLPEKKIVQRILKAYCDRLI
ncbi:MAG: glycosyltransferase family 4 protein [Thermoplasmata archaeon]